MKKFFKKIVPIIFIVIAVICVVFSSVFDVILISKLSENFKKYDIFYYITVATSSLVFGLSSLVISILNYNNGRIGRRKEKESLNTKALNIYSKIVETNEYKFSINTINNAIDKFKIDLNCMDLNVLISRVQNILIEDGNILIEKDDIAYEYFNRFANVPSFSGKDASSTQFDFYFTALVDSIRVVISKLAIISYEYLMGNFNSDLFDSVVKNDCIKYVVFSNLLEDYFEINSLSSDIVENSLEYHFIKLMEARINENKTRTKKSDV